LKRKNPFLFQKGILKYYKPILNWCLDFRYATAAFFFCILLVFIGVIVGDRLPFSAFPRLPRDRVSVRLTMPAGTNFEVTKFHIDRIEQAALELKDELNSEHGVVIIKDVFATAGGRPFGGGGPRGSRGPAAGVAEEGEVVVDMRGFDETGIQIGSREISMELRERVGEIPEAEEYGFSFSRGSGGSVSVQIMGPEIDVLKEVSQAVQKQLKTYQGIYDIEDTFERATEELELELKPAASQLGVTAQQLAQQVRQAFFGTEAQKIQRGRDEVNVMVRYPLHERRSLAALQTMMIRTQNGTEVPFEEVAQVVPGKAMPSISRVNRKRIIRIQAEGDSEAIDVDAVQADLVENFLPPLLAQYPGTEYSLEGRARDTQNNNAEFIKGVYFVLAVIYVLLAIPFKSYIQPLIVMSAIPFGIIGALLGHLIMNWILLNVMGRTSSPSSFVTMLSLLGMLALSGVVVNDSLVMVDFINQQIMKGMRLSEAVRLAGVRRFRPILLTSLTTFAGLLPLMFDSSSNDQFLIPMAISLGWGIIFATFITLLLVPVITLIFDDFTTGFCKLYNIDPNKKHEHEEEKELVEA